MIKDINAITPEYMKHRLEEETEQYKQEIKRLNDKINSIFSNFEQFINSYKNDNLDDFFYNFKIIRST